MTGNSYKLHIHHRAKKAGEDEHGNVIVAPSAGHFFLSLEDGSNITFYGKYPKSGSSIDLVFSQEKIKSEEERKLFDQLKNASNETGEEYVMTKTFKLSENQYNNAIRYVTSRIDMKSDYILGVSDCTDFVQSVYNAAGLLLYFTTAYSRKELLDLKSAAAIKVLHRYGSRDAMPQQFYCVDALSKSELAERLNIDPERVTPIPVFKYWPLPAQQIGDYIGENKFHVDIDQNMLKEADAIIERQTFTEEVADMEKMKKELQELFAEFEIMHNGPIGNEIHNEANKFETSNQDYNNFKHLKDLIRSELLHYKGEFQKLKEPALSHCGETGGETQGEIMAHYEEKMKELQAKFKNIFDKAQKNPGQYEYEPGETMPGMAYFNREEMKINNWLSAKLIGLQTITVENKSPNPGIDNQLAIIWGQALQKIKSREEFIDQLPGTLSDIQRGKLIITQEMEVMLQNSKNVPINKNSVPIQ